MLENDIIIAGDGLAAAMANLCTAQAVPRRRITWLVPHASPLDALSRKGADNHLITRNEEDPEALADGFPRGREHVLPECYDFGPLQLQEWLHTWDIPTTNASGQLRLPETSPGIAQELLPRIGATHILVRPEHSVLEVSPKPEGGFWVTVTGEKTLRCERLILAGDPGSVGRLGHIATDLGHTVERAQASLARFVIQHPALQGIQHETLADVCLTLPHLDLKASGTLEIHPWGIAGSSVLDLSCLAARELGSVKNMPIRVAWCGQLKVSRLLDERIRQYPRQRLVAEPIAELPLNLWQNLLSLAELDPDQHWGKLKKPQARTLQSVLEQTELRTLRKKLAPQERGICGGVAPEEIDFPTMSSRSVPGLHLAGDLVGVDGFAGGFHRHFQWLSGRAAGLAAGVA